MLLPVFLLNSINNNNKFIWESALVRKGIFAQINEIKRKEKKEFLIIY